MKLRIPTHVLDKLGLSKNTSGGQLVAAVGERLDQNEDAAFEAAHAATLAKLNVRPRP